MPIGVIVNSLAVFFGGLAGALLGNKIPSPISNALTLTFSVASMAIEITYITKIHTLPAVILALILGTSLGSFFTSNRAFNGVATESGNQSNAW